MEIIEGPALIERDEQPTLGIRVTTPFRGMLAVRDELQAELYDWLDAHPAEPFGPSFLRLHVIDMDGPMDIEVGVTVDGRTSGDERVRPGTLPAGTYASLAYRNHALRANKALLEWIAAEELPMDRRSEPAGDAFGCRYEANLTDPRTEPRKTRRVIELNIKLALL